MKGKYRQGKVKAKRSGRKWAISFSQYVKILKKKICTYCEKSIEGTSGHSLDRVDSSKGYTLSNVVVSCGKCNLIKNDSVSYDEMLLISSLLKTYRSLKK